MTRQTFTGDRCMPGAEEAGPATRQGFAGDGGSPGVEGVASVARRRLGGDGCPPGAEGAVPVTRQTFTADGCSPDAGEAAPASCPDCARRAVILRVVEGLQAKPPTGVQRAAADSIIRGILGCGCHAEASSARQDLALATPSRGNAMALTRRAELPRRAAGAVPLCPAEVPFARARLQP